MNLNDDQIKVVSYQSSRGAVSDLTQTYLSEHLGNNWNQLKRELTSGLSEISDPQHGFILLRKV